MLWRVPGGSPRRTSSSCTRLIRNWLLCFLWVMALQCVGSLLSNVVLSWVGNIVGVWLNEWDYSSTVYGAASGNCSWCRNLDWYNIHRCQCVVAITHACCTILIGCLYNWLSRHGSNLWSCPIKPLMVCTISLSKSSPSLLFSTPFESRTKTSGYKQQERGFQ